jgi:HEPN domain-containing protein
VTVLVGEWVAKTENDLKVAAHTLKLGRDCPTDAVCFHAQQCAEKYFKAVLVMRQVEFAKTHDLRILLRLAASTFRFDLNAEEQEWLSKFAVATRYPGEDEPISLTEARRAVRIARSVRREIRQVLPKAALRRKRK